MNMGFQTSSDCKSVLQAGQLVEFLSGWTPSAGLSSAEVVLELGVAMYEHCYWEVGISVYVSRPYMNMKKLYEHWMYWMYVSPSPLLPV